MEKMSRAYNDLNLLEVVFMSVAKTRIQADSSVIVQLTEQLEQERVASEKLRHRLEAVSNISAKSMAKVCDYRSVIARANERKQTMVDEHKKSYVLVKQLEVQNNELQAEIDQIKRQNQETQQILVDQERFSSFIKIVDNVNLTVKSFFQRVFG